MHHGGRGWLVSSSNRHWADPGGVVRAPGQAIVSHPEHDTVYVTDPACRSFSHATLKMFIEIVLENMPTGARRACT